MSEPTASGRLEALGRRSSNAADVESIANAGHAASGAVSAVMIGSGVLSAGSVGGAVCFAAPIAVGAAGAFAGAALGNLAGEKLLDLVGAPKIAQRGPQPATVGHQIAHTNAFAGAIGGLLVGVAVGALVAVTLSTGGLAAPLLIAAAASLAGGFAGSLVNSFLSNMATVTGTIITGSPNVFFEGKPVARVTDQVSCSKHPGPPPQIAEGSDTIGINGLPLARIGHKTTCGAAIQQGCSTIVADMTTGQYGPIDAQMSVFEQTIVSLTEVALCLSAVKFRSSRTGRLVFGEPVDPSDGAYVNCQTDFTYESVLPLELKRSYEGKDIIEGHLGARWICNWSQTITYDLGKKTAILEDGDGEVLQFSLGSSRRFNARNLKAPHYHLTGTPDMAFLFDVRTRQRFIFTPDTRPGETSRGTTYIWQGAKIVEEHRTRADTTEIYRWHYEPDTFTPVAVETDDNFYPIVTDHLGTPKEIFDKDGECVWQADHTLWGRIKILHEETSHRTHHMPLITCPLRFQNQWEDEETG